MEHWAATVDDRRCSKMETTVKSAANGEKYVSEMTDETLLSYSIKSIATFAGNLEEARPYEVSVLTVKARQKDVHHIFGLAIEGEDIHEKLQSTSDPNLFNTFQNNGSIDLADLETAILSSKTPDNDFLVRFVLFAIGIVLAPTAQCYVDAKYLKLVADIKSLQKLNWGCFTMKHLFRSIHKFNSLDQVSLQGNLPLLQVVMEICARQPEANNRKDPGSKKIVREDEGDSSRAQSQGQNMSSHQVEMIVAALNARCAEQENKIGRQLMEFQHRFDAKFLTLSEELIDIKSKSGSNPRLSLLEDEIKDLRRELNELKNQTKVSRQSESQKVGVEEQVNVCSDPFMATPKFDASTPRTSTPTPSARHVLPNKDDPRITPLKPLFDNDYVLTAEDKEAAIFIRGTHGPVEVHIPLNVNDNHWMAMVFNFDKEEIQILNSLKNQFDESKETALVEAIQTCMDGAVKDGLVTPDKPIKFTDWEVAEMYEAHIASEPINSQDDVQEIIGTVECKISDTSSSPKDPDTPSSPKKRRARGRPRELVYEEQAKKTKTMEELRVKFDSKTIAKQVASSMSRRSRKPSQAISSPFKLTKW
uniref:Ubiquitin-like protease family profile domain-containing protein n=1 Tax=Aegilops tauschii TaxID=37682 RepID=M8BY74_AEGTA